MTYPGCRWPHIVGAVVDRLRIALDCTVSYGVPLDGDKITDYVVVAGQSDEDEGAAGSLTQNYRTLAGNQSWRDENGFIDCEVWAFDGDHKAVRATTERAFATLDAIADELRESIDVGDSQALRVELSAGRVFHGADSTGCFCLVRFQLSYAAII